MQPHADTHTHKDMVLLCLHTHTLNSHVNDTPKRHDMTWPIIRTAVRCLLALSEWSPWKGEWRSAISAIRWKALTRQGQKKGFVCIKLWIHNGQFFSGINFSESNAITIMGYGFKGITHLMSKMFLLFLFLFLTHYPTLCLCLWIRMF